MTGRSTEVCPKTESTVLKVWVIVCSVDSFCHFVPFRFFFLFASLMETVVIKLWSVCPRQVLVLRVFLHIMHLCALWAGVCLSTCSGACLHGYVHWNLSKRSVGVSSRFFLGMQHRVRGFTTM